MQFTQVHEQCLVREHANAKLLSRFLPAIKHFAKRNHASGSDLNQLACGCERVQKQSDTGWRYIDQPPSDWFCVLNGDDRKHDRLTCSKPGLLPSFLRPTLRYPIAVWRDRKCD